MKFCELVNWVVSGTRFMVPGPVMLSDYKDDESYEQFAFWLHNAIKKSTDFGELGTLRIITDDEPALYNPFLKLFNCVHGLCYIHLEDSYIRYSLVVVVLLN